MGEANLKNGILILPLLRSIIITAEIYSFVLDSSKHFIYTDCIDSSIPFNYLMLSPPDL